MLLRARPGWVFCWKWACRLWENPSPQALSHRGFRRASLVRSWSAWVWRAEKQRRGADYALGLFLRAQSSRGRVTVEGAWKRAQKEQRESRVSRPRLLSEVSAPSCLAFCPVPARPISPLSSCLRGPCSPLTATCPCHAIHGSPSHELPKHSALPKPQSPGSFRDLGNEAEGFWGAVSTVGGQAGAPLQTLPLQSLPRATWAGVSIMMVTNLTLSRNCCLSQLLK